MDKLVLNNDKIYIADNIKIELDNYDKYFLYNILTNLVAEYVEKRNKFVDMELQYEKEPGVNYWIDVVPIYNKIRKLLFDNPYEKIRKKQITDSIYELYTIINILLKYLPSVYINAI